MNWASPGAIATAVVLYLILTLVVGIYFGRRGARDPEGFFVAGRSLGYIPTGFSMMATVASGGLFVGTTGQFYNFGVNFSGYIFAYIMIAPLTIWLLGPRMWRAASEFRWVSPQDIWGNYYQSNLLRVGGALVGLAFLAPYFASNAVALATILQQTLGVPYLAGVSLMVVGTVAYSLYGGMAALVYTDVLQGALMLLLVVGGPLALFVAAGGYQNVIASIPEYTTFSTSPGAYWVFLSWIIFIAFHPVTMPDRMTRFFAARSVDAIRRASLLTGILVPATTISLLLMGLAGRVLVPNISNTDEVLGAALLQYAPFLVPVLVVAIWAAGMSTFDSGVIGATVVVSRDLYGHYRPNVERNKLLAVSRLVVVLLAAASIYIVASQPPFIWDLIGMTVSIFLQYLPMLIGALYWKRSTKLAAEISWAFGIVLVIILTRWVSLPPGIFPGVIAVFPTALLFIILSLLTKPLPPEHVERYHSVFAGKPLPAGDD